MTSAQLQLTCPLCNFLLVAFGVYRPSNLASAVPIDFLGVVEADLTVVSSVVAVVAVEDGVDVVARTDATNGIHNGMASVHVMVLGVQIGV